MARVVLWALPLALVLSAAPMTGQAQEADAAPPAAAEAPAAEVPAEVQEAMQPLVTRLQAAERVRASATMTAVTAINGQTLGENEGVYQVASQQPNLFQMAVKMEGERMSLISDGQQMAAQVTPEAHLVASLPDSVEEIPGGLPMPLGPAAEPVLALSLAGNDPGTFLFADAASIALVDSEPLDEKPAVRLRVEREEGITWDLWIATGDEPAPLRLEMDFSEFFKRSRGANVPDGLTYIVRMDFTLWDIPEQLPARLFEFQPAEESQRYDSLQALAQALSGDEGGPHPLLGEAAPPFSAKDLQDEEVELARHQGEQVVILDFWATWCGPCVAALPEIKKVADEFADRGVAFYAVNIQEDTETIEEFLKTHELEISVLLDSEGEIADLYAVTGIPQTVLIGKDGRVEAVHVGFGGADELRTELEALVAGERLAPEAEDEEEEASSEADDAVPGP